MRATSARAALAVGVILGGGLGVGACWPLPGPPPYPEAQLHCYPVDATHDGVTEARAHDHTVDYSHGAWWMDGEVVALTPEEDTPVILCTYEAR